jgi:hypothetical protein
MRPLDHPENLTLEQRFQHIATILATGLRRLRPRIPSPANAAEQTAAKNPPELSPNGLELSEETRLSGHMG